MNQSAPSVDFPVGRFLGAAWISVALSAACAGVFVLSYQWGDFSGWRAMLLVATWLAFSCFSFSGLLRGQTKSWLSWDGRQWRVLSLFNDPPSHLPLDPLRSAQNLSEAAESLQDGYAMSVHLDLQKYLFVSLFNTKGFRQWFWMAKDSFPDRWHVFRCAVYSC